MAVTLIDSSFATTNPDASEHTIVTTNDYTVPSPTVIVAQVELANMASGDEIELRVVATGQAGAQVAQRETFVGAVDDAFWTSDPLPVTDRVDIEYVQISGSARSLPWALYRID